ncbi:hypothetical protein ABPG72_002125 [Tetrahymena utriculariae]
MLCQKSQQILMLTRTPFYLILLLELKTARQMQKLSSYIVTTKLTLLVFFSQQNTIENLNLTFFTKSLCFGKFTNDNEQLSLVKQLNQQGLISYPRINLGEPNPESIKKGFSSVKMYVDNSDTNAYDCNFYSNGETTYFVQKIRGYKKYFINFDSAVSSIDLDSFEQMLAILNERGIRIYQDYYTTDDKNPYILTLDATVYTKKVAQGIHNLMFKAISGNRAYSIGNQILTFYYFAYDANTQNTFFAERAIDLNPQEVAKKAENLSHYLRNI